MKVAIIGAGVAGLASARRAVQYNLETVVLEKTNCIGGIWVYSEDTNSTTKSTDCLTPMYANLRTNVPIQCMEFTGYEFKPKSGRCYPYHYEVLEYINSFVDYYDLRKLIQFNSRVSKITRLEPEGKWCVCVQNLKEGLHVEEYIFDAVMVCNGHYSKPYIPYIPGQETFCGVLTHSNIYRRSTPYKKKRLLLVGAGPSGKDIALECAEVATEVIISCDELKKTALDESRLLIKPKIKLIQNERVFFEDDTSCIVDVIMLCTGYLIDLSFLDESCGINVDEGKVVEPLYKKLINITQPSMCFVGLLEKTVVFQLTDLQAEVFVKILTGHIQLPDQSQMLASLKEENIRKVEAGIPKTHYFDIDTVIREYFDSLSDFGNIKPIAPVMFKIHEKNRTIRDHARMRDYVFEVIDDENFNLYEN